MELITILAVALGLSVDSFAVSVGCGLSVPTIRFRQAVPFALVLALFQAGMPVLGWSLGSVLGSVIGGWDHWLAFVLLVLVGSRMLAESVRKRNGRPVSFNPLEWNVMICLALATSIDALVVGFSMGLLSVGIWAAAFLIGSVTFLASMLGMLFGKHWGKRLGNTFEMAGGILLILLGLKILIEHQVF